MYVFMTIKNTHAKIKLVNSKTQLKLLLLSKLGFIVNSTKFTNKGWRNNRIKMYLRPLALFFC